MKQTAMQELKDKIQHAIEELNDELNEYKAGYKQCLINIQNDIDSQMLAMEKEQIIEAYKTSHISMMTAEQYYKETYESE